METDEQQNDEPLSPEEAEAPVTPDEGTEPEEEPGEEEPV
jgi:hypothetical protein